MEIVTLENLRSPETDRRKQNSHNEKMNLQVKVITKRIIRMYEHVPFCLVI